MIREGLQGLPVTAGLPGLLAYLATARLACHCGQQASVHEFAHICPFPGLHITDCSTTRHLCLEASAAVHCFALHDGAYILRCLCRAERSYGRYECGS